MRNAYRILFLLFLLPTLLFAQDSNLIVETFGAPDVDGSFRVGFSRTGADIQWLQAIDHYVSVEKKNHAERQNGDYLLLIDCPQHAFSLQQVGGVFAKDPSSSVWDAQPIEGGMQFTLADGNGLEFVKTFRHDAQARGFTVELTLRNESSEAGGSILTMRLGGPSLVSPKVTSLFGDVSLAIAAPTDDSEVKTVKPDAEGNIQQLGVMPSMLSFAGSSNRFFGAFVWPKDDLSKNSLTQFEVQTIPPRAGVEPADNLSTRVVYGLRIGVPPKNQATTLSYGVYLGPKSYREFDTLPEPARFAPILDYDLNPPCCGIDIPGGRFMAKMLLSLLGTFYDFLGNYGFAIILLTFLVRGAMFPLNFRMQKSMRAYGSKMAKLKPQMEAMKKTHADDQKAYQQAMIQFQREHKIMPPIGGCLPIFLTMPIYLGLFTALRTAYDLRQMPFLGWIDDLSMSDALFNLGFWPDQFNLLPLLWIALFVTMTLRQPLPTDPQQRQMQMMMRFMPIMFGVMLYTYASALLLYMVTSMVWSLIESSIVKKVLGPADPNAAAMAPTVM